MTFAGFTAGAWSTSDLLSDIRREARLADEDIDYTDAVLLREATNILFTRIAQVHSSARDGRTLIETERTVSSDAVNEDGTAYVIPPWACGDNLSSVFYTAPDGTEEFELSYIGADNEVDYTTTETGDPWGFTIIDNRIRLFPQPATNGGTLRFLYPRRHGQLVPATSIRAVSAVATASSGTRTKLTLASAPPASWVVGAWVDVYEATLPHAFDLTDAQITAVSGSDVTIAVSYAKASAVINSTVTRCFVSLSGEIGHVNVPVEFRPALVSMTAAKLLRDMGFAADALDHENQAQRFLDPVQDIINPRTKGVKEKIVNKYSLFRRNARGSRGGWA